MCADRRYYQWCHSPETEAKLKADGWEYAGETGRYPSRLMSKRCQCDAEPEECEVLQDLGRACETHGCNNDGGAA